MRDRAFSVRAAPNRDEQMHRIPREDSSRAENRDFMEDSVKECEKSAKIKGKKERETDLEHVIALCALVDLRVELLLCSGMTVSTIVSVLAHLRIEPFVHCLCRRAWG